MMREGGTVLDLRTDKQIKNHGYDEPFNITVVESGSTYSDPKSGETHIISDMQMLIIGNSQGPPAFRISCSQNRL